MDLTALYLMRPAQRAEESTEGVNCKDASEAKATCESLPVTRDSSSLEKIAA